MNNQVKALTNADVLRTITTSPMIDGFKGYTKAWPVKFAGPVPTPEMFTVALLFGANRKAGPESGFVAMQLRENGASVAELAAAFNSGPAHNHSRALSADNKGAGAHYFTRTKGNGRFWLTFTAKGQKAIERLLHGMTAQMAAGEADKPAGAVKTKRAGKVAGAKTLTSKAKGGSGKHKAKKPADEQVSPELLATVEAELNERGHELEPMPAEQQPAHPDQQSDGKQQ